MLGSRRKISYLTIAVIGSFDSPNRLGSLVVPGVEVAMEAGKLLEDLPKLWKEANLTEQRKLLLTMLGGVYVDAVEEKCIVAIRPKPAFMPIFEVATTGADSGVILISEKELPPVDEDQEADKAPCLWWRRGRVELYPKHESILLLYAGWAMTPGTVPVLT